MRGVGAYGKMPSLGDFFRIATPRSFCEPWDAWVQRLLTQTRAALGARWEGCYMSAPIWRFSLAPGLAGPEPAAGVLMASVDRVGRAFPLTLVQVGAGCAPDFVALEEIALSALDDTMTKDKLADVLRDLPPGANTAAPLRQGAEWRADLAGKPLAFDTVALPTGQDALRLFDPTASAVQA